MEGHENTMKAQREGSSIAVHIDIVEEERGGWLTSRPSHFVPGKETRYPLHSGLTEPRGLSDRKHAH
jgi:hypothetical protein